MNEIKENAEGRLYIAVILALYAGLRKAEILFLEWDDADFENATIIIKSEYSKGNKSRTIRISSELEKVRFSLKKEDPFSSKIMSNWSKDRLQRKWDKLRAGLSINTVIDEQTGKELTIHFHDLRHQYAIYLRDSGVPMVDIQHLMGHSSLRITEKYYANTAKVIEQDSINKIHDLLPLVKKSG